VDKIDHTGGAARGIMVMMMIVVRHRLVESVSIQHSMVFVKSIYV